MSDKNIGTDFDPSSIGFHTFKEREAMAEKKELPVYSKAESIISLVFHILGAAIALTALVVIYCYALRDTINFSGDGGYGIMGILAVALVLVGTALLCLSSARYHLKSINEKDHHLAKAVNIGLYYFVLGAIFTAYAFIWMRINVTGRITWRYLGILMMVAMWIVSIFGMVLNFRHDEKDHSPTKVYNYLVAALALWLPVCHYVILASPVVDIKIALWLVIFAPITLDIGLVFLSEGKNKAGFHTVWHVVSYLALAEEAVALFYYSMFVASQVYSL
jgi:hypothetical protein